MNDLKPSEFMMVGRHYVAWSLHVPSRGYGDWSLVSLLWRPAESNGERISLHAISFRRNLHREEITTLTATKVFWGVKLTDFPWVMVKAKERVILATPIPTRAMQGEYREKVGV